MGWISHWWRKSPFGRPPELSITEDADSLLVRVSLRGWRLAATVSALAFAGCAVILVRGFVNQPFFFAVIVLAGFLGVIMSVREDHIELRVSNLEFETLGYFGGSYRRRRSEPRMSIRGLEYRTTEEVPGLYAEMPFYWACLLPYVNEQQADEIIERIYRRFPDTPVPSDPYSQKLTTLGLQ